QGQPAGQAWVMHVRLPAEVCESLAAASDGKQLVLGERAVVPHPFGRIMEREAADLLLRYRVQVSNVPVIATAHLDAVCIDEDELREVLGGADRHFRGDPPAERAADEDGVVDAQLLHQCHVEVHEVGYMPKLLGPL